MARSPLAALAFDASGLRASLPQDKSHGNLSNFVETIVTDTAEESTEAGRVLCSATAADIAPAILSTVESLNVSVSH